MNNPHATFKLYAFPRAAMTEKDARISGKPAVRYIGHCVLAGKTYGIEAHVVLEGERKHFEGNVIDWQELIRRYVAMPTPVTGDLVDQAESLPFDDPLEGVK